MTDLLLPPVLDLFAGSGGLTAGFQQAGFTVVGACENWAPAIDTYRANHHHPVHAVDLADPVATRTVLDPVFADLRPAIIGGPPCQDFSSAGNRVEGERADLTERFAALVAHYRPPFAVMENVPRIRTAAVYQRAITLLEHAGYTVRNIVVDASRFGVPQLRKRCITFAHPNPHVVTGFITWWDTHGSASPMTVRAALPDIDTETYYQHPRSYARRGIFHVDAPSPTVRGQNRPIPANYQPHPGDAGPATTSRPLTTSERAALQTFPPDYRWCGSRTAIEQQIGNAVPVRLAEHIGTAIRTALAMSA